DGQQGIVKLGKLSDRALIFLYKSKKILITVAKPRPSASLPTSFSMTGKKSSLKWRGGTYYVQSVLQI
ncbi:hypothetical protein, partial [Komagataeibacter europaeus]|uniref:hypothetical protein n=1 Tax=Komagataeibacter europaeus TaxID=33995 RepID=UPI0022316FCB